MTISNRGFALPLVLIILALLTALSFGLTRMITANTTLLLERKADWEEELRIRDAVEQVVLLLLVGDYDPVSVRDESGALPLNNTPTDINGLTVRVQSWSGLYSMSLMGINNINPVLLKLMDRNLAQRVSAEVSDWIDQDSERRFRGGEAVDYASSRMPQRPRNAPLRSINELLELPSVTPDMMNGRDGVPGLKELFLAGGEDNFDLGTAPDILLGPLLGLPANTIKDIVQAREEANWSEVRFLIDENHWLFNDHPPFYKGLKYRLEFQTSRSVRSRVQLELTPYDQQGLYAVIDWQVPEYPYE